MPEDQFKRDTYLGDGLYASFDGFQVRVFAFNGVNTTDEVFLEPETYRALVDYANRKWEIKP